MKLETVSGVNSLILYAQNVNRTNLFGPDRLFFQTDYASFFVDLAHELETNIHDDFVSLWIKQCNTYVEKVKEHLIQFLEEHNIKGFTEEQIDKICNKFRGNLGEILCNLLIIKGKINMCENDVCIPVDPQHEQYVDVTGQHVNDGLPIDIQVKNFDFGNNVGRRVFVKCSDTFARHISGKEADITDVNDLVKYIATPHQVIFSVTTYESDLLMEEYEGRVYFIGPYEINNIGLGGSSKNSIKGNYGWFYQIAEEIKNLK